MYSCRKAREIHTGDLEVYSDDAFISARVENVEKRSAQVIVTLHNDCPAGLLDSHVIVSIPRVGYKTTVPGSVSRYWNFLRITAVCCHEPIW